MPDHSPVPSRQKSVTFYGDQILAVQMEDGTVFVPLRQMCELLGIGYQGQIDRIRRDPVLHKYVEKVPIGRGEESGSGGVQETNCLALTHVPGWLFGISARRVREDVREKLILYQEQVYTVIWEAFRDEVEARQSHFSSQPPLDDLEAIAQMGLAIYRMARQQRAMEARLDTIEDVVWEMEERTRSELGVLQQQLGALELRLSAPRPSKISEEQAAELSQAVKVVAVALGKQSGRNEFGAIYGELYRRFGITSYRNLPRHAFTDAMAWLKEWFHSLGGESDE